MPRRPTISIVGAGKLGLALARLLAQSDYRIGEIVVRAGTRPSAVARTVAQGVHAKALSMDQAALDADLIWLCVPDDVLRECASEVARHRTKARIALHSSGALASDVLLPLKKRGLAVAAAHPLMSFVAGPPPSLKDVLFAIEGDKTAVAAGSRVALALGGVPFKIARKNKALYHAFGAFTSPLLIAHLATGEVLARAAGVPEGSIRKAMAPIVRRTIENYLARGGAAAFSGPLVRGDIETIRMHLKALRKYPTALGVYSALLRQALESLPVANRMALGKLVKIK